MSGPSARLPDYLPQYGFAVETKFTELVQNNPFLFRVHTPKSPTRADVLFPALKFDTRYTRDTGSPSPDPPTPTYADVVRHLDWTTRHSSPYVSASFSFMWAVWEAVRRYHFGVKHDVEIAVIEASALSTHSPTAVEILRSVPSGERHENHWKWYHFAQQSQLVLVYGGIPHTAVLTSVPLLHIIDKLPSYCLHPPPAVQPRNQIERLSPSFLLLKPSFRNFCIAQSATFLCASADIRFLDSTSGAVRLALAFLGVWFQWMLRLQPPREDDDDPNMFSDAAVAKVTELARAIAAWPAAGETTKAWDAVVREIALLVAEEVKPHRTIAGNPGTELICHSPAPVSKRLKPAPNPNFDASKVECPDSAIPLFLDPRNFLPTPPPTPPPTLVFRRPGSTERGSLTSPASALSPHDESAIGETSSETHSGPDAACVEPSPGVSASASAENPPELAEGDAAESILQPQPHLAPSAPTPPVVHSPQLPLQFHFHSKSETLSCLLTGFFFCALIMVVLSQRRPVLLYVG
ncbi:hypothetical protein B0H14DRAFT_2541046 [Mycena olivaceomarginata]|nr:hypothetical protein B0H14DRAFT_2541046 [Mycena olivaceomarginata]